MTHDELTNFVHGLPENYARNAPIVIREAVRPVFLAWRPEYGPLGGYRDLCVPASWLADAMKDDDAAAAVDAWLDAGGRMLIDSGLEERAAAHAKRYRLQLDDVLQLDDIDGAADAFDEYRAVVERFGDRAWGYFDFPLGSFEQRRARRFMLPADRLFCTYRPLRDGWDALSDLAWVYRRVAVEMPADASPEARVRILATMHERRAEYPGLSIHLRRAVVDEQLVAYPPDSIDWSGWIEGLKRDGVHERVACRAFSRVGMKGADPYATSAFVADAAARNWNDLLRGRNATRAEPWASAMGSLQGAIIGTLEPRTAGAKVGEAFAQDCAPGVLIERAGLVMFGRGDEPEAIVPPDVMRCAAAEMAAAVELDMREALGVAVDERGASTGVTSHEAFAALWEQISSVRRLAIVRDAAGLPKLLRPVPSFDESQSVDIPESSPAPAGGDKAPSDDAS